MESLTEDESLTEEESLTEVVPLRLSPSEFAWLKSAANSNECSRSALVRHVLLIYRDQRARGAACLQVVSRRVGRRKKK